MANIISLDVGSKRIGVAMADDKLPIALPLSTIIVDGTELQKITDIIKQNNVTTVVIGYPRNQSGDPTDQTVVTELFARRIRDVSNVVFQDESLTSVMAEDALKSSGKPYQKGDIDALAASIILQDYLEENYGAK